MLLEQHEGTLDHGASGRRVRDAGATLVDLLVAMGVMAVFMVMFTGGVLQIYSTTNRTEAVAEAQSRISLVLARLDEQIRYAAAISQPAAIAGDGTYVEYLTSNYGPARCSQLRLDANTAELKQRTWTQGQTPPAWSQTPVLMVPVTAAEPFTRPAADAGSGYQRLRLRAATTSGSGSAARTRQLDITFTALNSSAKTDSSAVCTEGRAYP